MPWLYGSGNTQVIQIFCCSVAFCNRVEDCSEDEAQHQIRRGLHLSVKLGTSFFLQCFVPWWTKTRLKQARKVDAGHSHTNMWCGCVVVLVVSPLCGVIVSHLCGRFV